MAGAAARLSARRPGVTSAAPKGTSSPSARKAAGARTRVTARAAAGPAEAGKTLSVWLLERERDGEIDSDLAILLTSIASACKQISSIVRAAPLQGNTGVANAVNTSGDEVKKLDVIANNVFLNAVRTTGRAGIIVTEEEDTPIAVDAVVSSRGGSGYICTFDPIDGSSNLDACVTSGAIFGIYNPNEACKLADVDMGDADAVLDECLTSVQQSGESLAAAGYCMFSASAVFMLTVKNGVFGFTLDSQCGEFLLTHANVKIPEPGNGGQTIVSANLGNVTLWDPKLAGYLDTLYESGAAEAAGLTLDKPYSYRYIGALVGDFHRTLLYGGIWLYPPDSKAPEGKARLLYEVAPIALIAEEAGGLAVHGDKAEARVLDVVPKSTHQKFPMFVGSKPEVNRLQTYLAAE